MEKLSHYDAEGSAHMVDVSAKPATRREAEASAFVVLSDSVLAALPQNPKGNPLEVARFAGIQAAKRTADLIPMCHPLPLSFIDVSAAVVSGGIEIHSIAATVAGTGVEMEALTAAAVAALTIYDMCKAMDKSITIREIVLVRKSGGKSGDYTRQVTPPIQQSSDECTTPKIRGRDNVSEQGRDAG
jgi:cyclic pyranopterin phosphate synthase